MTTSPPPERLSALRAVWHRREAELQAQWLRLRRSAIAHPAPETDSAAESAFDAYRMHLLDVPDVPDEPEADVPDGPRPV